MVHLRLKSIYKAFKQSGAALTNQPGTGKRAITDGKGGAPDSRVAAAAALARAAGLPGESLDAAFDSLTPESELALAGDVGAVLQAAAAAANSNSSNRIPQYPFRTNSNTFTSSNTSSKAPNLTSVGSRTEEEAKAAEAALLAELDREEEEKNKKSKKKKKKSSKKEAIAKEKAEKEDLERQKAEEQQRLKEELEETELRIAEAKLEEKKGSQPAPPPPVIDEMEQILEALITAEDIDGIESFLHSLKGVPGKAALRKNAKKAIRRLNPGGNSSADNNTANAAGASRSVISDDNARSLGATAPVLSHQYHHQYHHASPYVKDGELLTVVSTNHKDTRTELVSHISPAVVGWVIGKGGMRIREMMEKSSTKIWIDQDSMKADESRIMYISGKKNSVEAAYRMVEELVAKSPMGMNDSHNKQKKILNIKQPMMRPPTSADFPPPSGSAINESSGPPPSVAGAECVARLTCEPRFVALLIGRRGWTVKHIQDVSGARVDIDQTVTPREVTISGSQKSVASAQRLVRDVLSYPNAQLHYNDKDGNPSGDSDLSAALAAKAQVEAAAKASKSAEDAAKALSKIQKQQEEEMNRLKQLKAETDKQERVHQQQLQQKQQQQQQQLQQQQLQQQQQMQQQREREIQLQRQQQQIRQQQLQQQQRQQQMKKQQQLQQQQQMLHRQQQQQQHKQPMSQSPLPPPPNLAAPNIGGESLLGGGIGSLGGASLGNLWGGAQNTSPSLGGPALWDQSSSGPSSSGVDSIFGAGGFGSSSLGGPGGGGGAGGSGALGGDFWGGGNSLLPAGLVDDTPSSANPAAPGGSNFGLPPGMAGGLGSQALGKSGGKGGQVDSFLASLGLDRYSGVFKEHEIDMDALRVMTEFDFQRIGVPLGPRVKIMSVFSDGGK